MVCGLEAELCSGLRSVRDWGRGVVEAEAKREPEALQS